MEYVTGGDLRLLLTALGAFSEDMTCFYFCEMAEGLHYLHEQGIVHW